MTVSLQIHLDFKDNMHVYWLGCSHLIGIWLEAKLYLQFGKGDTGYDQVIMINIQM